MSYVVVFFMFSVLRSEVIIRFVDISGIVDHHCLNFLFIKHLQKISVFPQNIEVYWWPLHISIKMLAIVLVKIHYLIHSKLLIYIWVIFKKMKTLCDIEGEISNWTNWHNFGHKIMSIWYIFQIQLLSAIYEDNNFFSNFY